MNTGLLSFMPLSAARARAAWFEKGAFFADDQPASLAIDFENTRYAVNQQNKNPVSFSRSSTKTTRKSTAAIEEIGSNVLGITQNNDGVKGFQCEEFRTNLVEDSFDPTQWNPVGGVTITDLNDNLGSLPRVSIASAGQTWHRAEFSANNLTSGEKCAVTIFYEAGTSSSCRISLRANSLESQLSGTPGNLNISLESRGTFEDIRQIDHGEYFEVSFVFVPNSSAFYQCAIGPNTETVGGTIIARFAQFEPDVEFPTSPIISNGSSESRTVDNAAITGTDFSDWYNPTEGTFYMELYIPHEPASGDFPFPFVVSDGTASQRIYFFTSSSLSLEFLIRDGGVTQASASAGTLVLGAVNKFAVAYDEENVSVSLNGETVVTDTVGNLPIVNQIQIGSGVSQLWPVNGIIPKLAYFPFKALDATIEGMTP